MTVTIVTTDPLVLIMVTAVTAATEEVITAEEDMATEGMATEGDPHPDTTTHTKTTKVWMPWTNSTRG